MKKIISCILALLLILTSINSTAIFAVDVETPTISFDTVETEAGETVTLQLSIDNNPGIAGLAVSLKYDTNVLSLTETKKGTLFSGFTAAKNFAWDESEDVTADGILATFTFKILETAASGEYNIEVIVRSCTNENLDDVICNVQNGKITVKSKPVAATGVTLNKEFLYLKTGESETLIATVTPDNSTNKAVTWSSEDGTIATVDNNGKVTAIKKGTAIIIVTTEEGGFTDTCAVSVACSHTNKTPVEAKASDCKNQGWNAYVKCDDCGQLFEADGTTEIAEIPFRPLSNNHIGGTASCTEQAVCSVCGRSYGALVSHSYTAETKKAEALKVEGNCRDKAVYWYSCSACGKVENNDSHTFLGDKVADNHVGGTTLVNPSEANHKTQTDGYTGDTQCLGCNEIVNYGQPILAGAHTPANVWSNDSEYHWKECNVVGCGVVIDNSKDAHKSTGANVATCQKAAVCDVCGVSYGTVADHDWNTSAWEKDASGHWNKCNTAGCTEKNDFAGHTPDHQGSATEEYAIKCSVCGWIIEQQLAHTHVFDKEVVDEQYKVSGATCLKPATYYKSCACGEKGTETFENGRVIDHTEGTAWERDADNHWHICTIAGCGVVIESSKAAHTSDRAAATETDPVKCSVCGYEIAPALGHTHAHGTDWKYDANNHWNECACGDKANTTVHKDDNKDGKCDICEYEVGTVTPNPEDSNKPSGDVQSPETSDNSMMWVWITLLLVSGACVVAIRKKRVR